MMGNGCPAKVTPVVSKSLPARMWAANHTDGTDGSRWGSLQSMGRPGVVRSPDTAHALLAPTELGSQRAGSWNTAGTSSPACGPVLERVSARMVGLASG